MSTVINTNIAAVRTHNVYNRNNDYMNTAMTRVATGMKINSAKDGASTWAISEKMRERMRANDQANQNVQNDTALIKTAQGGISNTIDILKTLKERAINAANDSNLNEDRARIAVEVDQLVQQIDDNVKKVKFNGRTLLDGSLTDTTEAKFTPADESGSATSAGSATSTPVKMDTSKTEANAAVYAAGVQALTNNANFGEHATTSALGNTDVSKGSSTSKLVDLVNSSTLRNSAITDANHMFNEGDVVTLSFTVDGEKKENTFTVEKDSTLNDLLNGGLAGNGVKTVWGAQAALTDSKGKSIFTSNTTTHDDTTTAVKNTANAWTIVGDKGKVVSDITLSISGENEDIGRDNFLNMFALTSSHFVYTEAEVKATSPGLTFYVGGEANFGLTFGINAMDSSTLGVSSLANSMKTKDDAEAAIKTIDDALATALNEQTKLGAWENRLGYTADNLTTMNENLEAADSAMRDSDIAKEMTTYMKYSVLAQASQYMLAQSSQNAFSVLNLLQA